MREQRISRFVVRGDGSLVVIDPRPSDVDLITAFVPDFSIAEEPLPGFLGSRLARTKRAGSGIQLDLLSTAVTDTLIARLGRDRDEAMAPGEASALDVRIELARRMLEQCELCGLKCRVNRLSGETGRCGLGADATVYESYLHIAEEAPINPSLNVSLRGCGMRCRYCQQFPALTPHGLSGERLDASMWDRLDLARARSLSFIGGNPTENLLAVLQFLSAAPDDFNLPIVWNCSGYDSAKAVRLLDGVVDCYVPDCKYGNESCAKAWSDSSRYVETMCDAIAAMTAQAVPVYVRMLVLPGHVDCCHLPTLRLLAPFRHRIGVHVMSQYQPTFLISPRDGAMDGEVRGGEVDRVVNHARAEGFALVGPPPDVHSGSAMGVSLSDKED